RTDGRAGTAGMPQVREGQHAPLERLRSRRSADHIQGLGLQQSRMRLQHPHRQRRDQLRQGAQPITQMTSRAGAGGYGGSQGRRSHRYHGLTPSGVPVTTARESAELDEATIAAGVPSRALMQRAGAAAAGEIARLLCNTPGGTVTIYVGSGNNGGDGWVVARALAAAGTRVDVVT